MFHNDWAKPHITVSGVSVSGSDLTVTVYRAGGPDTDGGYVTELSGLDESCETIADLHAQDLSKAMKAANENKQIKNKYVNKVVPGPDGMSVPLGGVVENTLDMQTNLTDAAQVVFRDVSIAPDSAKRWTGEVGAGVVPATEKEVDLRRGLRSAGEQPFVSRLAGLSFRVWQDGNEPSAG